jgi:myosin heavy subunit
MVVSYVGSANNYKGMYDKLKTENQSLQSQSKQMQSLYSEQVKKTELLEEKLNLEIKSLQERNNELAANLQKTDRLSQEYQSRSESWKGVMTGFEQSVSAMLDSLKLTQDQLEKARSQNIKDQKDLNQITADLYEKIVELQRLEAERRRLLEQKTGLEKQLSQGSNGSAPAAVTQVADMAKPAATPVSANIKGLITEIDQSLVTVSVGSADGVGKGMVLHVTRGSDFLCDIAITDVDINKSAGVLEMVQQQPKIGDVVSTKL